MRVDSFNGPYRFLSNFYPSPIVIQKHISAPTVEHAYQAFKMTKLENAIEILAAPTPGMTKRLAKNLPIRPDWDEIKMEVMEHLLTLKFAQNPDLAQKLLNTGTMELIEGNTWGDRFWGVCNGYGENNLGKLLMKIRSDIGP